MQEDQVVGPLRRTEVQDRERPFAPPGKRDETTREERDLLLLWRALAGGQLDEGGDAIGGFGGPIQHLQR